MAKGIITRRGFFGVAGMAALGAAAGLAGCGQSRSEASSAGAESTSAATGSEVSGASAGASADASAAASAEAASSAASGDTSSAASESAVASADAGSTGSAADSSNALVLVFSRADENYGVGTVEVGNTMVLANMIAEKKSADLFHIERAQDYPADYDACCDEALEEQNAGARPELKSMPDLTGYDMVYFGTPVWWGDLPMPVFTAIEASDWNGKTIAPFCTHAGSGGSGVFASMASACEGAAILEGLAMPGTTAQNDRADAEAQVDSWLASLGV